MKLSDYTTAELVAEIARRTGGGSSHYGCKCAPELRMEYTATGDERFLPRTGCLRCDRWDGPEVMR